MEGVCLCLYVNCSNGDRSSVMIRCIQHAGEQSMCLLALYDSSNKRSNIQRVRTAHCVINTDFPQLLFLFNALLQLKLFQLSQVYLLVSDSLLYKPK